MKENPCYITFPITCKYYFMHEFVCTIVSGSFFSKTSLLTRLSLEFKQCITQPSQVF